GNRSTGLLAAYDGQTSLTSAASIEFDLKPGYVDLGAYEFQGSSLNTTPPTVTGTTPAIVGTSGQTGALVTQVAVAFSAAVNVIDANSAAIYELRKAGSNGFGSTDDVVYPLTPSYSAISQTVTLSIGGLSGGLPTGSYRLTIHSGSLGS